MNNINEAKPYSQLKNEIQDQLNKFGLERYYFPDSSKVNEQSVGLSLDSDICCHFFVGDNMDILSGLNLNSSLKIDYIYIDPPYNTGNAFVYQDDLRVKEAGLFGSHTKWMAFMIPRLVAAKSLLSSDGLISISIDDHEQAYLKIVMDSIFGEDNFIANVAVCRSKNGKGSRSNVAVNHEYVLIYGMSQKSKVLGLPAPIEDYDKKDKYGQYRIDGLFRKKGDASLREDRPNMFYPLYCNTETGVVSIYRTSESELEVFPVDSKKIERRWLWGKDKAEKESYKLFVSKSGSVSVKNYYTDDKRIKLRSFLSDNRYLTDAATRQVKEVFGIKAFDTPKPVGLIEDLIISQTDSDAVVMDFFAGSGTTAHAVANINHSTGSKRKIILVESQSEISMKHPAFKEGFTTIDAITKYRLNYIKSNVENFDFVVHN